MYKWPCLILPQFCKTKLSVKIESEELNENGTPKSILEWEGYCNYQEKAKKIWSEKKVLVEITGTCMIPGDIAPDNATISEGKVTIFGVERDLEMGTKVRNPDGSVNYTVLNIR